MAISDQSTERRNAASSDSTDIGELFAQRFGVVSIYVVMLLLLAGAIVWSGVKTAENVQQYHQDYKTLQDMKKQERKLQVEHQRLLIEQQTFSATPQIASRAVAELGMFSPTLKDKLIIQPGVAVAEPMIPTETEVDNNKSDSTKVSRVTDLALTDSEAMEQGL